MQMRHNLKLIVKFPTRSRPVKFFQMLDLYYIFMRDNNFEFIISCDTDDETMNNEEVRKRLDSYPYLKYFFGDNKSKVQAVNANLDDAVFDILLLASDDMQPVKIGYDLIIKNKMSVFFPDMDGVLWFNDGFQKNQLNTLCIMGNVYYKKFGYIYNPEYISLYSDTEFTAVSNMLNKSKYFDEILIKHIQYSIVKESPDELYLRNDNVVIFNKDLATYQRRRSENFSDAIIKKEINAKQ